MARQYEKNIENENSKWILYTFSFIPVNTGINSTFALGVLSKDVFERHKLTGSEVSSPSIRLDATKFVSSVCTVIEAICRKFAIGAKTEHCSGMRKVHLRLTFLVLLKRVFALKGA